MQLLCRAALLLATTSLLACVNLQDPSRDEKIAPELREYCIAKAHELIGPKTELSRIGHLSARAPLDCVAVEPLSNSSMRGKALHVSRLVILRQSDLGWIVVFDASRHMKNPGGYVGLDYLDEDYAFEGWSVHVESEGSDDKPRFTLFFSDLVNGQGQGASIEVGWNEATGRYQEFEYYSSRTFKSELKNPPRKPTGCGAPVAGCR